MCGAPGDTAYVVETYDPVLGEWPQQRQRTVLVLCREHDPLTRPGPPPWPERPDEEPDA